MARLIQKSGYIKPQDAGGYMEYIATREGVEIHPLDSGPVTKEQQKLIDKLLKDFPDTEELFEYADFLTDPNKQMASEFITTALDFNVQNISSGSGYMDYISLRPRVEKHGSHGLFGVAETVDLDKTLAELDQYSGNVWTIIYSLHREDATRLGYDNAAAWRTLLMMHQAELCKAMKIPAEKFRWYAAFHNEGHHPHIHMMVWSDDPKEGFLTKDGIRIMRSKLTNEIFRDEMHELYVNKDVAYRELVSVSRDAIEALVALINAEHYDGPVILQLMAQLVAALETTGGKKQYGYLPKPIKAIVDSIVDELAKQSEIAQCYEVWNRVKDEVDGMYGGKPRIHNPLSQQKEFRAIKNRVIQEAERVRQALHEEVDLPKVDMAVISSEPVKVQQNNAVPIVTPELMAAVIRLLYHMGRLFQVTPLPQPPGKVFIDSKRRRRLQEKRMAMGHKKDDHEDEVKYTDPRQIM